MARNKTVQRESTVSAVVGDAIGMIQSLTEEIQEVVDGASGTPRENTGRIQTLSDTADTLSNISEPDVPEIVGDLKVSYMEQVSTRGLSRGSQRDNATSMLQAAVDAMREWLDEQKDPEAMQDAIDEVDSAADEIDNIISDAEGVDFPGMFG